MTWSRFDDLYDEHEKIEAAWDAHPRAVGLHVMATTACNRWLSDGVIRPKWLTRKLPRAQERARVLSVMVSTGLFDVLAAGDSHQLVDSDGNVIDVGPYEEDRYVVHDFLDRHDSSVQVKDRRRRDAERKKAVRERKSEQSPAGVRPDSNGSPSGIHAESAGSPSRARAGGRGGARPHPDPTRPDPDSPPTPQRGEWASPPTKPEGKRQRERARYDEEVKDYAAWLLPDDPEPHRTQYVQSALGWLPGHLDRAVTNDDVVRWVRQHRVGAQVRDFNAKAQEAA